MSRDPVNSFGMKFTVDLQSTWNRIDFSVDFFPRDLTLRRVNLAYRVRFHGD